MFHIMSNTYEYVDRSEDFIDACTIAIRFQKETKKGFVVYKVEEIFNTNFLEEEPPMLKVVGS